MIPRYTLPALEAIWSEDQKYALWVRIEVAVCRALAKRGEIPRDAFAAIEARAKVEPARVAEIEAKVHHDVNAFLDALAEQIGPASRYVHLGLTSSDVLDTCLALQISAAARAVPGRVRPRAGGARAAARSSSSARPASGAPTASSPSRRRSG